MYKERQSHLAQQERKIIGLPARGEVAAQQEQIDDRPMILHFGDIRPEDRGLVGGKAANLAELYQIGMPVPEGVCITSRVFDEYTSSGKLPEGLLKQVLEIKKQLGGKIAIRSSANCEDGEDLSMAGVFSTEYVVDDEEVGLALESVLSQARSEEVTAALRLHDVAPETVKLPMVIQQLIEPDIAGVVYTKVNGNSMLMQFAPGFGDAIVDGKTDGTMVMVNKDEPKIKKSSRLSHAPIRPQALRDLHGYARTIENHYHGRAQDIEFAVQGAEVSILQSRTHTTNIESIEIDETPEDTLEATKEQLQRLANAEKKRLRTDTFVVSDSNFSELLPRPTEMDFGVFSYIFTGSDGIPGAIQLGRQDIGYHIDGNSVGYMHYIGGKPYFSIAGDALTFYAGFPDTQQEYLDKQVNGYLAAITTDPQKGHYPEIYLYNQDPTEEELRKLYGDKAALYHAKHDAFNKQMGVLAAEFQENFYTKGLPAIEAFIQQEQSVDLDALDEKQLVMYSAAVLEHLRQKSCVDFVKAARLGFYYSKQVMDELRTIVDSTDQRSARFNVEQLYAQLMQGLDGSMITDADIAIANAETDDKAREIAKPLVGHYSTGEMLEIRHPRLKDDEEALGAYVAGIRSTDYAAKFAQQQAGRIEVEEQVLAMVPPDRKDEVAQIIHSAQSYMALRETVKYHFVREYSQLRDALELLGKKLGLPEGDIYYVYPRELPELVEERVAIQPLIDSRKQAYANYADFSLPSVIRETDIHTLSLDDGKDTKQTEFSGKFLAEGAAVEGVVVNLADFEDPREVTELIRQLQEQETPFVLVSSQINLGHDPFIAASAGLIIEHAGIVSHGAQRARELHKGALGGIKSKYFKTGERVFLDPAKLSVKKVQLPKEA